MAWTKFERSYVEENHRRLSVKQLVEALGKTEKAVRNKMQRMGIRIGLPKNDVVWTTAEKEVLRDNPNMGLIPLKRLIQNHTKLAIKAKKHKLGYVRKPKNKSDGYDVRYERKNGHSRPIRLHREIIERSIGRKLTRSEQIHHINFDKTDNRNENLFLCNNRSYHMGLHHQVAHLIPMLLKRGVVVFNREKGVYEIC